MTDPAPVRTDGQLRLMAVAIAVVVPAMAWMLSGTIGYRGQAGAGAICFIAICAACSTNLRAVSWRTVLWGIALQLTLALFILKLQIGDVRPGYALFSAVANIVRQFLEFTNAGSYFVFGALANQEVMGNVLGPRTASSSRLRRCRPSSSSRRSSPSSTTSAFCRSSCG
jgi:hypothetical protein